MPVRNIPVFVFLEMDGIGFSYFQCTDAHFFRLLRMPLTYPQCTFPCSKAHSMAWRMKSSGMSFAQFSFSFGYEKIYQNRIAFIQTTGQVQMYVYLSCFFISIDRLAMKGEVIGDLYVVQEK